MTLGRIGVTAHFDGHALQLTDYLSTYSKADGGFEPFFVRSGSDAFRTVPEDGAALKLAHGDELIVGTAVYTLRT